MFGTLNFRSYLHILIFFGLATNLATFQKMGAFSYLLVTLGPGACIIKHYGFVDYVTVVTGKNSVIHKKSVATKY
jgi:hypothetical protein